MAQKTLEEALGISSDAEPPPSEVNEPKLTVKGFAKGILSSPQYRESVKRRVLADTLPAAVELRLYDYAHGKPVDKVEIKDTTDRLEDLSTDELMARLETLKVATAKLADDDAVPGAMDQKLGGHIH